MALQESRLEIREFGEMNFEPKAKKLKPEISDDDDIALDQILSNGRTETITTPSMSDCDSEENSEKLEKIDDQDKPDDLEKTTKLKETENKESSENSKESEFDKSLEIIEPRNHEEINEKEENKENIESKITDTDSKMDDSESKINVSDSNDEVSETVSEFKDSKSKTDSKIDEESKKYQDDLEEKAEFKEESQKSSEIIEVPSSDSIEEKSLSESQDLENEIQKIEQKQKEIVEADDNSTQPPDVNESEKNDSLDIIDPPNADKKVSEDYEKLKAENEKYKKEIERLEKANKVWIFDFDQQVEDFRKGQGYRPHSTYEKLIKIQMDKFEQRSSRGKIDDSDMNRIRKNIQTICSNHSTMYNKIKEFCSNNDELKKTVTNLKEKAEKLGLGEKVEKVSTACNTILTEESSGFKKLTKLKARANRRTVKYLDRKRTQVVNTSSPAPNSPGIQYVVQTVNQQQLNNGGIFMVQNNGSNIPLQLVNGQNKIQNVIPVSRSSIPTQVQSAVPVTINRSAQSRSPLSSQATPRTNLTPPTQSSAPTRTSPSAGQKRPRPTNSGGTIDLTDDDSSAKRLSTSSIPNGSIRNSESVMSRNVRQRYRDTAVSVPKDTSVVNTIIGQVKLPTPPPPPKFEKQNVPENVKSLPRKLKIDANFEGTNNMKLVWTFDDSAKDSLTRNSERAECAFYELFVLTIRKSDQSETKRLWQRIGGKDIPGHRIPVKCSLKNFDRENDYVFLVRGKDSHGRVGSFSDYALARK